MGSWVHRWEPSPPRPASALPRDTIESPEEPRYHGPKVERGSLRIPLGRAFRLPSDALTGSADRGLRAALLRETRAYSCLRRCYPIIAEIRSNVLVADPRR